MSAKKIGIISTALIFIILLAFHGPKGEISVLEKLELMSLDYRFLLSGIQNPGDNVVIVAIDDRSIEQVGRWPWDRKQVAKVVDILSKGGAKTIGLDIIFSESQVSSEKAVLSDVLNKIEKDKNGDNLTALKGEIENAIKAFDSDVILAESFRNAGNTVIALSMSAQDSQRSENQRKPSDDLLENLKRFAYFLESDLAGLKEELKPITAGQALIPLNIFLDATASAGNAEAVSTDIDGVVRKEWMIEKYGDSYYPPLSFEVARLYMNIPFENIKINFGNGIETGKFLIPTDERGSYLINYYGPQNTFRYYSCSDILEGKISPSLLKGRAVLIGYAATGLGDKWVTPYGIMFGVEKQATLVKNFIDQRFLYHPKLSFIYDIFAVLIIGTMLSFVLPKMAPMKSTFFAAAMLALVIATGIILFISQSLWVNMVFPMLTVFVLYISITSYRFLTEEREKRKIKGAFQQYLSPSVVNAITKDPSKLKLGGEEKTLSILFSDIRGFTTLSESLTPAQLVQLLNEYFSEMTDVITEVNSGTLDKFIGDAIMAFWGAPVEMKDHALKSSLSALGMIEKLHKLRVKWDAEGKPPVNIGIGINTGDVVVGNMGSDRRFDYTVMGDAVNLASRLEGLNKTYGTNIIISEFTKSELPDKLITREIDLVRVKGKLKPVKIYELMGESDDDSKLITKAKMFEEGINLYRNRQWQEAANKFKEIKKQFSDDGPSSVYIERCTAYMQSPPPDDWDGVFVMKTK
ncbi:MAG: adenylate/guanylate cyclase domain-containing protein [Candidatus Schekmanbacteria bacterium]|nr:adenylate/guanylate cyclase domain-containing protein [Candidatus Schekmanbacteria bacterium]